MPKRKKKRHILASMVNSVAGTKILSDGHSSEPDVDDPEAALEFAFRHSQRPCTIKHQSQNCALNPQCYRGLGEKREGVWLIMESLGRDPSERLRDDGQYVGLKNLGATCYMNSLLQMLYINTYFRAAVYRWEDCGHADEKIMHHLQVLFAHLQNSIESSFNPHEITDLLNIKTNVQQDAQEFFKLFVSYLEGPLSHSRNPMLKSLIEDQFVGEMRYVTTCSKCKSNSMRTCKYYELELTIVKDCCLLQDCLDAMTREEQLTEDNQYLCNTCETLQDAGRRVEIMEVPDVLNFQLVRFAFDFKRNQKIKIADKIKFPIKINVQRWMAPEARERHSPQECVYSLIGILAHQGESAYAGHYMAHGCSQVDNMWRRYNDETVSDHDMTQLGLCGDYDPFEKTLESRMAYMLIYRRDGSSTPPIPDVPRHLAEIVDRSNHEFMMQMTAYGEEKAAAKLALESREAEYQEVMANITVDASHEQYHWISTEWFKRWVTDVDPGPVDNSALLCEHKEVDPRKMEGLKKISIHAWRMLHSKYGGGPELTNANECVHCSMMMWHQKIAKDTQTRIRYDIVNKLAVKVPQDQGYWIASEWLDAWRKGWPDQQQRHEIMFAPCKAITCEHNALTPDTKKRRAVSEEVWQHFRQQFVEGPEYPRATADECAECLVARHLVDERKSHRAKEKIQFVWLYNMQTKPRQKDFSGSATYFMVPTAWVNEWMEWVDDPTVEERIAGPECSSLLCSHGLLEHDPATYNPSVTVKDKMTPFVLVKESYWADFSGLYPTDREVRCVATCEGKECNWATDPSVCDECAVKRQEVEFLRRLDYSNKKISVRMGESSPFYSFRRKDKAVDLHVHSSDTVDILKMKILQAMNVAPHEQDLYYEDKLIESDALTLAQVGILPGTTVKLVRVERDVPIPAAMMVEEGFVGSHLVSGHAADEKPRVWTCGACTLENALEDERCSACDTARVIDSPKPADTGQNGRSAATWMCGRCTLVNQAAETTCGACGQPR